MKPTYLTLLSLLILFSCSQVKNEETPPPVEEELPNIVLLIGDDQGYPYFGFMGADYVYTPNMDSIAASGYLFTNGYVPMNHCRPSLQSLMTGTLPIDYNKRVEELLQAELSTKRFDSPENQRAFEVDFRHHAMKNFETLPKLLAKKGYVSFQGGKWWEYNYENGGFTEGMTTGWTEEDRKAGGKWFKQFMGGSGLNLGRITMEPVFDFIDRNLDNPFYIWYAPELPHYPFDAPDKYYNLYKDKDMTESARRYYANCTWFDDGVGELVKHLKEKGEFDNTLFVYVNDNGWEQNPDQEFRHDSLRWHNGGDKGKLSMYDQSFRTPLIFSFQEKIKGVKNNSHLIHSSDIPATILDYLNIEIPKNYFGQSFKSVIEGDTTKLRKEIIGKVHKVRSEEDMMGKDIEGYWYRNKDWFFQWDVTADTIALFDMEKDPFNDINLAEVHTDVSEEILNILMDWREKKKQ